MDTRVLQKGHFSKKKPRESRHINIWPIRNHYSQKKVQKVKCRGSDQTIEKKIEPPKSKKFLILKFL